MMLMGLPPLLVVNWHFDELGWWNILFFGLVAVCVASGEWMMLLGAALVFAFLGYGYMLLLELIGAYLLALLISVVMMGIIGLTERAAPE